MTKEMRGSLAQEEHLNHRYDPILGRVTKCTERGGGDNFKLLLASACKEVPVVRNKKKEKWKNQRAPNWGRQGEIGFGGEN